MSSLRGLGPCGKWFRGLTPTATSCCRCAAEDAGEAKSSRPRLFHIVRMGLFKALGLLVIVSFVAGCQDDQTLKPQAKKNVFIGEGSGVAPVRVKPTDTIDPGTVLSEDKVKLTVASWDQIETSIAEHKGKVVVVDLWSTSCVPCLRELPKLADLQRQYPKTVVCMSVSVDYTGVASETPESHREKVMKILEGRDMTIQNFISSTLDFDVYEKIDLASIPAILVYDRDGELLKRFDNDMNEYGEEGFTYADHINPIVERALGE